MPEERDHTLEARLQRILVNTGLTNEDGAQVTDFESRGSAAKDLMRLNRATLKTLMEAAYRAGRDERLPR